MGLLRLLLALSVVSNHTDTLLGWDLVGGLVAVKAFFIISGFYMTLILNGKYTGPGSYTLFLQNRFLRIFPLYWLVLLLTLATAIVTYAAMDIPWKMEPYLRYNNYMDLPSHVFLIFSNLFIFGQDLIMFLGINLKSGMLFFTENFRHTNPQLHMFLLVPQAWSLSLELLF